MRWFEEQRIQWIGETLRIFGFINRAHLMKKFGVSEPQASADLQKFQKLHPEAMWYDPSEKCYRASEF